MNLNYKKMKKLFLQQSYLDSWEDYQRSLRKSSYIIWDYVVLTASNEDQAESYRRQLEYRLDLGLLSSRTKYVVLADPEGKRVGSGGATLNVIKYLAEQDTKSSLNHFAGKRFLVIHSGGDSRRVPQYSATGKLFSPVPRELPNGRSSTLFDELIIAMTGVAGRIPEGMLVLSGDVLLLFNPLQIDAQFRGAAAISIKESVTVGKNHGVFLNDGTDHVERFLHKQSEKQLSALGAVSEQNTVDLDTGAVIMDSALLNALFGLISTDNQVDDRKYEEFVNEKSRISFYGDFLYPLARKSTLEDYYKEAPEGSFCEELMNCRTKIWSALHGFQMSMICLSPAEFIHFGTTKELRELMTVGVDDYEFLDWKKQVLTNYGGICSFAVNNSFLSESAVVGDNSYLEDSYVGNYTVVGSGSILSNVELEDVIIPENVVIHGLRIKKGFYVSRVYGIEDNPKEGMVDDARFLGTTLLSFMEKNKISEEELWKERDKILWYANLYPICTNQKSSVYWALILCKMAKGDASDAEVEAWKKEKRCSLYDSFNLADVQAIIPWKQKIENCVNVEKFIQQIRDGIDYKEALKVFGDAGINEDQYYMLMSRAEDSDFSTRIRILYDVSRYMKYHHKVFGGVHYDYLENMCFKEIQKVIYENGKEKIPSFDHLRIEKEEVHIELPVRVNWGGGWTDTPPYCNENGGVVLNAAITLNGSYPIHVYAKKIEKMQIEFASSDIGVTGIAESVAEIQNCHNPYDFFALHKAALIACGLVPLDGDANLNDILEKLGGGLYLSTEVVGVPKGSGLGTSSILAGACVKAIFELLGQELSDNDLYDIVLCMEQIMSTGGGWQDQVGGVTPGIKLITTKPGIDQQIKVQPIALDEKTMKELQQRFALIYTGQRRLARNLLREVVGNYIGGRQESLRALRNMERMATLMKFELERGNIDEFAKLLNDHWELSKLLDKGSTNTCIDQIFLACEDLIDGRFIAGAGGGGFLQVILKKGVTKTELEERLHEVFQDSGVSMWIADFV